MDDQDFWDMAFVSIASMRFHPRNAGDPLVKIRGAARLADQMLEERRCRFGQQQGQSWVERSDFLDKKTRTQ